MNAYFLSICFFIGTIPFNLLIARVFKVGVTPGSQGMKFWPAGFITVLLDICKGIVAVVLATPTGIDLLSGLLGSATNVFDVEVSPLSIWSAGFFAILGHCFSPWLHFRGGKGVATAFGAVLVLSPIPALFGLVGFVLTFLHRGIVSLSSISGLIVAAVAYLVLNPVGVHLWMGAAMCFLVLLRHEVNIDALLENREPSFK
jgi:glycerol-3-phosphate acyltransferase PlsY